MQRRTRDAAAQATIILIVMTMAITIIVKRLPRARKSRICSNIPTRVRQAPAFRRGRSTPARCIRNITRSAPETVPSVEWRWSPRLSLWTLHPIHELADMTLRFRVGLVLPLPPLLLALGRRLVGPHAAG